MKMKMMKMKMKMTKQFHQKMKINKNAKNNKTSTNTKKDENKNILLEYIEDVDDKLFKDYSNGKNFNSFINEFHSATNEEDKEKVVKELKDTDNIVYHYIENVFNIS